VQVVIPSLGAVEAPRPVPQPAVDVSAIARPAPSDVPRLDVASPQPGASVGRSLLVQGVATGLDRVDIFLEPDRDGGGPLVGSGIPGELSPGARLSRPLGAGEFIAPSTLPRGGHTLYIHARSSITGQEIVVSIPISVS
jgi:hypothetical protein